MANISDEQIRDATRLQNRALRTMNGNLRRKVEATQVDADVKIAALFDAPTDAEAALSELWGNALFDCGPDDYDYMVSKIIEKFKKFPEGAY